MKKTLVKYGVPLVAFWSGGVAILLVDVHSKIGTVPLDVVLQLVKWPYYALLYVLGV
jgi:hypothetical protein